MVKKHVLLGLSENVLELLGNEECIKMLTGELKGAISFETCRGSAYINGRITSKGILEN